MTSDPQPLGDPGVGEDPWSGPSRFRDLKESLVRVALTFCAGVTVLTTLSIVGILGIETVKFFAGSGVGPLQFLLGTTLEPDGEPPKFGILPLIYGTFIIAAGSSVIALPIGLLSAIFLSEYAPRKLRNVLKPTLELLAGVPSIVYGYLALTLVTPALRWIFEPRFKVDSYNVLSACIVVGIMVIPMVSSLSEDVLSSVPRSLREAAYGLGATKFEVSTRVVLPAGLSGVMAAFILAISRAVGETMAVLLAAGTGQELTFNPLRSLETMTAYIVGVVGGDAPVGTPPYQSLFAVGMTLFVITLLLNVLSNFILRRYREAYH
jgi:phosphate transport system permease protein